MSQFSFLSNRSFLVQFGFLLFSVGVHGAILMLPLSPKTKTNPPKVAAVKIIRLPSAKGGSGLKLTPRSMVKTPQPTIQVKSQVKSKLAPSTPLRANLSRKPVPQAAPTLPSTPTPQSETAFDDFPLYPNAEKGSCGLFQGSQDAASQYTQDLATQVATYFEKELPTKGYSAKSEPQAVKGQVYEVFKGGLRKFLNLVSCAEKGTAIILSDQPLDLSKLKSVAVTSQTEAVFDAVLKQLDQFGAERIDVPEFYFAQPEAFFEPSAKDPKSYDTSKPHPGLNGDFVVILDKTPEQLYESFFASNLRKSGFTAVIASAYGGGSVYEIKQNTFVRYLNLIPTQTGTGTIVVVWNRLPS